MAGAVDGVEVEDFVRKNIFNTREIPSVTLAQGAEVDGDIITTGTSFQSKMDNFFADAVNTGDISTIARNLQFTGKVAITGPVTVSKLNDIPASTWVETGQGSTEQVISAGKVFSKLVTVQGNVVSDDIAGTDLGDKFTDAMKIDEDALITGPSVTFSAETTLASENLRAPLEEVFDTLMEDFVTQISLVVDKLYAYYTEYY